MGILKHITGKSKDGSMKMVMIHYSGLPNFPKKWTLDMILDEENKALVFKPYMNKKIPTVTLPFSKIISAKSKTEEEFKKQSKMGRAVVGGLLFGETGAVVGAVTADDKKKVNILYVITYNSESGEKEIVLKENGNLNFFKFKKELEKYLPEEKSEHEVIDGNITL